MNIFYLSNEPDDCARQHVDKHVVKMILETAQLLSNAHHMLDGDQVIKPIYKLTHKNHPSAIWVRSSDKHYAWLWSLLLSLCKEYTYRYGKVHKVQRDGLINVLEEPPRNIPRTDFMNDPPPAMPDEYKTNNAIESYRNYYKGAKKHFARWTNRPVPEWFNE